MVSVPQAEQPATGGQDFDQAIESVKVERNTKGHNWSYRVARKEGESWEDVFRTIDMLESALVRRFGDGK
jgi:hypothetical protein